MREDGPSRHRAPAVPVRREDAKRPGAAAGREITRRHDRDAGEGAHFDAFPGCGAPEPLEPTLSEAAHVLAHVDALGPARQGHPQRLLDRVATTKDEVRATGAESVAERDERLHEEGDSVGRAERHEDRVVEDEQRHDPVGALEGRRQRGMVVQGGDPG